MKILVRALALAMALVLTLGIAFYVVKREAIAFALLSPQQKFAQAWKDDLALLKGSGKLPPQWSEIRSIEVRSEPSPARDWLEHVSAPIATNPNGGFKLQLFALHWIDENRYGVTIEYWLIDAKSGNTIWEFARTLKLGFVY
jgi:hypothetical protein